MFALYSDKSPGTLEQEHMFDFSHEGRLTGGEAGTQRLFVNCPLVQTLSPAHAGPLGRLPSPASRISIKRFNFRNVAVPSGFG